jgi:hypothetical protein
MQEQLTLIPTSPALTYLATEQAKPMQKLIEKVKQLLDYCAT